MDFLPNEILLEIFKYFQANDLISLTNVCSKFYHLICNSERLMDKIPLVLDARHIDIKYQKYSKIIVADLDGNLAVNILKKLNTSVKQLTFKRGSYCLKHIHQILLACPNVKRIKFTRGSLRGDVELSESELPKLKLNLLQLENVGSQILHILKNSEISRLEFTIGRRICQHEFVPEELGTFFTFNCGSLKHLKLERIAWNINDMFESGNLDRMNFHLESLVLNDILIDSSTFFEDFMKLHLASLVRLELVMIEEFNFSTLLKSMPKLRHLRIIGTPIELYEPLESIEKLEIEIPPLIRHFPNLRELKISSSSQFGPYQIHLWNEYFCHNNLNSIEIGNLSLINFPHIPALRCLKLNNVDRIYMEVFYQNPQLEEVIIEKRAGPIMRYDYEIEFISSQLSKLKLLEIVGGKVCRRFLDLVKTRCQNLRYLRLMNVDVVAS